MKKLILLLVIGLSPIMANAQRVDKPGEPYNVYCRMVYYTTEVTIDILDEHHFIRDEEEKKIKFNSSSDALTYLSKRGWDLVVYVGDNKYLLKKEVKNDEEALRGLVLVDKNKKK